MLSFTDEKKLNPFTDEEFEQVHDALTQAFGKNNFKVPPEKGILNGDIWQGKRVRIELIHHVEDASEEYILKLPTDSTLATSPSPADSGLH